MQHTSATTPIHPFEPPTNPSPIIKREEQPLTPSMALIQLVNDPIRRGKSRRAIEILFPTPSDAQYLMGYLLAAGLPIPPMANAQQALHALTKLGWAFIPACYGGPRAGDIYICSNHARQPSEVGVVARVDVRGEWFYAVSCPEDRFRRNISDIPLIEGWLRIIGSGHE